MNVGGFFKHQKETSDNDRYKEFFSPLLEDTMEELFEQWSELQVTKCLIVRVNSSSNNVSSLELRNKKNNAATGPSCRQQYCNQPG